MSIQTDFVLVRSGATDNETFILIRPSLIVAMERAWNAPGEFHVRYLLAASDPENIQQGLISESDARRVDGASRVTE